MDDRESPIDCPYLQSARKKKKSLPRISELAINPGQLLLYIIADIITTANSEIINAALCIPEKLYSQPKSRRLNALYNRQKKYETRSFRSKGKLARVDPVQLNPASLHDKSSVQEDCC